MKSQRKLLFIPFFFLLFLLIFLLMLNKSEVKSRTTLSEGFLKNLRSTATFLNAYSSSPAFISAEKQINDFLQQWEINGASLALIKEGKLVYAKGFGYADTERKIKAKANHTYRIASVSKLFTAVAIMKLVEEGKIKLNDKAFGKEGILNDAIYQGAADPNIYRMEVQHLLRHTAGWLNQLRTDPMFVPVPIAQLMKSPSPPELKTVVRFMFSQRGLFEPGKFYDYSNFGYVMLGEIIEKVSGMPYLEYLRKELLQPLGVKKVYIAKNRSRERQPEEVKYYTQKKEKRNLSIYGTGDSASRAYEGTDTEALGAAGGLVLSAMDLARFLVSIDGFQNKKDILQPETIALMTQPESKDSTRQTFIGWKTVDEEKWWRTGSLASTCISVTRRNDGISWVFVTNTGSWRGPFFSYEIEGLMRRITAGIKAWPEVDLFEWKE